MLANQTARIFVLFIGGHAVCFPISTEDCGSGRTVREQTAAASRQGCCPRIFLAQLRRWFREAHGFHKLRPETRQGGELR
ncbi:hypothetical protein PLANPX_0042 [Lacipirellula parvula]|uniref:Uncharacterized protein n=1 Tax=Lacipirellula parvula TaxID=2650471 RepID=A0A5K7X1T6_9BACT|nr:hypothetical protein PLANPX_0042 [Lacipirellula parvula]